MSKFRLLCLLLCCIALPLYAADSAAQREFNTLMSRSAKGNADDQYRLGEMYEKGVGTAPDIAMAYLWFNKAALQGHVRAKERLSSMEKNRPESTEEQARVDAAMRALQQQSEHDATRQRAKEKPGTETRPQPAKAAPVVKPAEPAPAKPVAATPAPASTKEENKEKGTGAGEFSSNPCKGPQAKFLSTCQ